MVLAFLGVGGNSAMLSTTFIKPFFLHAENSLPQVRTHIHDLFSLLCCEAAWVPHVFIMVHRFPFHPELYHFLKFLSLVLREYWCERWLVITGSNFYIQKCLHFLCIETAGRQTNTGRQKDLIKLQRVIRPSDCFIWCPYSFLEKCPNCNDYRIIILSFLITSCVYIGQ